MSNTKKEYFDRLVNLHNEIDTLNQDIKQIKEDFEENLPEENFAEVNRVAKLEATQKLGQAVAKAEQFIEVVDELKG
jgi:regulator of replication initiation timing